MKCDKAIEITAFLKGEVPQEDRETLRSHFDQCESCAADIVRQQQLLKSIATLERVEPSPTFPWRVREAFLRAHPEYLRPAIPDRLTLWERIWAALKVAPAWAISVAAHAVLLAVLAVLIFSHHWTAKGPDEIVYTFRPNQPNPPGAGHVTPSDATPGETMPGAIADPNREKFEAGMRGWRGRLARDRAHAAFFENRTTQASVPIRTALFWLSKAQKPDGRWSGAPEAEFSHDIGVTGLALLAFLADGETPKAGEYAETMRKGLRFLMAQQVVSGLIGTDKGPYLYDHAIAALALLEAWMMTKDEELAPAAAAAVQYSVSAQNSTGGWGYASRAPDNDTSVGGWQILLLRLAEIQGNSGVIPSLVQANAAVRSVTDASGKVGYRAPRQYPNGYRALTAVGMLSHELASAAPDAELLKKQAEILLEQSPVAGSESNDLYFAHFGSLALFQTGGDAWTKWWDPLRERILKAQLPDGSWPATFDRWHAQAGPVCTTALATLVLETARRYPRLSE